MKDPTPSASSNFVFISYNHKDVKWAKWLQKKLEWYRLPTEAHNEFSDSRYIRPVFRDRDTLTAGILNDSLRAHLEASRFLVVICSPNSAKSEWVSEEIRAFIEDDGKTDRQKAFVRFVAHILGLRFDALWQRHKRFIRRLAVILSVCAVALLALSYWFMVPVKLQVSVQGEACQLPEMEDGTLNLNGSEYAFSRPDTTLSLGTLPGYFRFKTVPISFHADRFYQDTTARVPIRAGVRQHFVLPVRRDSTFAVFAGRVFDGDADDVLSVPVAGVKISVGNRSDETDADGCFRIVFPLAEQSETKSVTLNREGYQTVTREDESPSSELMYLMHRP